jgi:hypothetical protein
MLPTSTRFVPSQTCDESMSAAAAGVRSRDLLSERKDLQGGGIAATDHEHAECCQD